MRSVAVILLTLLGLVYWASEPSSLLAFSSPYNSQISTLDEFECGDIEAKKRVEDAIASAELLGGSAGVYSHKCGIFVSAFGDRDKGEALKFELNTSTRVASITKPMTAVAIMQLKERGLLDLDDKLSVYLTNAPESHGNIKIRELLNNTSGVPHYSSALDAMSFTRFETLNEASEFIFDKGVKFESGAQYLYSSFGYTLLGRVIEVVSGLSFEDYMRQNIWLPAGMENTRLEHTHISNDKSKLYLDIGGFFIKSPYTDLSVIFPAGGVESTAKDILLFGEAIIENKLIRKETLEQMVDTTHSLSHTIGDSPYGLGWSVYIHQELGTILSHGGSQPGASGFFQILLDKKVSSVGLANTYGSKNRVRQLAYEFAGVALDSVSP